MIDWRIDTHDKALRKANGYLSFLRDCYEDWTDEHKAISEAIETIRNNYREVRNER